MSELPPAGWYPDPETPGSLRWWDGGQWTDRRQQAASSVAPPTPPPGPAQEPAPLVAPTAAPALTETVIVRTSDVPSRSRRPLILALVGLVLAAAIGGALWMRQNSDDGLASGSGTLDGRTEAFQKALDDASPAQSDDGSIDVEAFDDSFDQGPDAETQSNLRNALTAAKTVATDNEGFFLGTAEAEAEVLNQAEPSLQFATQPGTDADVVVVVAEDPVATEPAPSPGLTTAIVLYGQSDSGTWFAIAATREGSVTYGQSTAGPEGVDSLAEVTAGRFT